MIRTLLLCVLIAGCGALRKKSVSAPASSGHAFPSPSIDNLGDGAFVNGIEAAQLTELHARGGLGAYRDDLADGQAARVMPLPLGCPPMEIAVPRVFLHRCPNEVLDSVVPLVSVEVSAVHIGLRRRTAKRHQYEPMDRSHRPNSVFIEQDTKIAATRHSRREISRPLASVSLVGKRPNISKVRRFVPSFMSGNGLPNLVHGGGLQC